MRDVLTVVDGMRHLPLLIACSVEEELLSNYGC